MSGIKDYVEFRSVLEQSITDIEELSKQFPEDEMIASIKRQLAKVHFWTHGGRQVSKEDAAKLSFGVMAGKAVDDINSAMALQLYRIANYIDDTAI
jgi:hypothetical protein